MAGNFRSVLDKGSFLPAKNALTIASGYASLDVYMLTKIFLEIARIQEGSLSYFGMAFYEGTYEKNWMQLQGLNKKLKKFGEWIRRICYLNGRRYHGEVYYFMMKILQKNIYVGSSNFFQIIGTKGISSVYYTYFC
jgi:hypothetical protein